MGFNRSNTSLLALSYGFVCLGIGSLESLGRLGFFGTTYRIFVHRIFYGFDNRNVEHFYGLDCGKSGNCIKSNDFIHTGRIYFRRRNFSDKSSCVMGCRFFSYIPADLAISFYTRHNSTRSKFTRDKFRNRSVHDLHGDCFNNFVREIFKKSCRNFIATKI